MASTESTHYLHPDFDVTKITMNQIREILSEHHVKLPTGMVKKQQLIDLFNQHIRPQVPEINESDTSDSDRETKATSKATTTSATPKTTRARQSRAKKAADDDADDEDNETPPSMASASTRKKRIASKAKVDNDEPAQAEVKPRLKRSTSRARATTEKNNVESKMEEPSRGRNIQRTVTQSEDESEPVRLQRPKREAKKKKDENFSYENPFQSGSESERRRSRPRSRSRSSTRKARVERADAMENVFKVPAQPQFSRFMRTPEPDKSESSHSRTKPAATSATTTTTTTTTTSAAEDKKTAKAHSTPKKVSTDGLPTPKHRDMASTLDFIDQDFVKTLRQNVGPISLVLAIVLLAYGIWLRQKRIEIGFCTEAELEPTVRPWYYPTCIPCPDRATCLRSDEKPICPPEYILKPQLLSFGNLFPITPVCVLNKAKGYRAFQVADAAEKLLHLHAGNIECSLLRDKAAPDSMEYKARRGLSVDELRFHVEQLKDSNVSDEEFSEYWNIAVKELRRRSNKVVFEEGLASEERIRSLKPQKSLGCRLRQVLVRWIIKFRLFFLAVLLTVAGGFGVRAYILRRRKEVRIVNGLVQNVLSKLSDQAHYYYVDPVIYPEPYLPQTQLRDALLSDVHSASRRQEIWSQVQAVVERNSNVRTSTQEVRGEMHRVWEWVGASGMLGQHGGGPSAVASGVERGRGRNQRGATVPEVEMQEPIGRGIRARGVPKVPPRTGPHGSFFGMRRQDSEYLNPENSLYPSLSQDYPSE